LSEQGREMKTLLPPRQFGCIVERLA